MTADGGRPEWNTYSLLFDLFVANQAVGRLLADAMRDGPLTPADYAIYSVVFEEEAVSPTTMAARLGMPLTTVIDQVRLMERRGHVRRHRNPADGRSFLVVLTGEGSRPIGRRAGDSSWPTMRSSPASRWMRTPLRTVLAAITQAADHAMERQTAPRS